jgi:hypothetical protein
MPRGGPRPGAGRPPITPATVRAKVLGFRVTPAELAGAEAVRRKGETMSAMARVAWLQEVERRVAAARRVLKQEKEG